MLLVTGGAGFIGSNFVIDWLEQAKGPVHVVDALTYAGNLHNLNAVQDLETFGFSRGDICDRPFIEELLLRVRPRAIVHFAAESHVDRSIHAPADFVRTNVNGTFELLEAVRHYWNRLHGREKQVFRFLHVSTDEVYGSLGGGDPAFTEGAGYAPNSPYAASKAASDHFVRAYHHTYHLPTLTTNCSNNFGPFQFPEKLIPLMILNALNGDPLPIYGDGENVRDWLYVKDHCRGIQAVLDRGRIGETYNIGARSEKRNIDLVRELCLVLDQVSPRQAGSYIDLITYVPDRPGHDRRYAIDPSKIETELDWRPVESFESGLRQTIDWYIGNPRWVSNVRDSRYREWTELQYAVRLSSS